MWERACACVCARVFACVRACVRVSARTRISSLYTGQATRSPSPGDKPKVGSMHIFSKRRASAAPLVVLLGFYDASAFSLSSATSLQCLMYGPMSRSCWSRVECSGQESSNLGHSKTKSPRVVIVPNHVPDCTVPDLVIWYNWLKSELLCKNFAEFSAI